MLRVLGELGGSVFQDKSMNGILVQKYGGSSVATPEKIGAIADRIAVCLKENPHMVVAVSAMGKTTDQLVALAHQVAAKPRGREMDLLLASGEQVAVSLLGLALQERGIPAVSLTGAQCRIRTDNMFNRALIQSIDTSRIQDELNSGKVVIVAGFQGITGDDEVTTLGRGGGDITGAAVAAALNARVCEICTDVDGIYSTDPSVVPHARLLAEVSYEEAIELATGGAKVLHPRAAEICMKYQIPIHVRSSFHMKPGTWIRGGEAMMEKAAVSAISSDKKIAKVTLLNVPDRPGIAAKVFQDLADAEINVRLIIQSAASEKLARITFIIGAELLDAAVELSERWKKEGLARDVIVERDVAKISIVGSRLASTPGIAARMFAVLAAEGINIDCISSSEMKIACVIAGDQLEHAVRAVHDEFFGRPEGSVEEASGPMGERESGRGEERERGRAGQTKRPTEPRA
ncbi:MAG TPA: aspartate kinase [Acidobacteriota bacterium]|jgi:aspartate kinase